MAKSTKNLVIKNSLHADITIPLYTSANECQGPNRFVITTLSDGVLYGQMASVDVPIAEMPNTYRTLVRVTNGLKSVLEIYSIGGKKTKNFTYSTAGVYPVGDAQLDTGWVTPLRLQVTSYVVAGGGGGKGGQNGSNGFAWIPGGPGAGGEGGGSGTVGTLTTIFNITKFAGHDALQLTVGAGGAGGLAPPDINQQTLGLEGSNGTNSKIEYWDGSAWVSKIVGVAGNRGTKNTPQEGGIGGISQKPIISLTTSNVIASPGAGGHGGKGGNGAKDGFSYCGLGQPGIKGTDGYISVDVEYWS